MVFIEGAKKVEQPYSGRRKGGLSLRGVAFMTVLAVVESTLLSFRLSYKNTVPRDDCDGFGGFGGCGGFGRDGCPPP